MYILFLLGMVDKIFHYNIADTEHVDDLSAMVQEFYQLFQKRLEHKQLYQGVATKIPFWLT